MVVLLVCWDWMDVGADPTAGAIRLEKHDWLGVCDIVVDEVGAMVVVGAEFCTDAIDEVGSERVVRVWLCIDPVHEVDMTRVVGVELCNDPTDEADTMVVVFME